MLPGVVMIVRRGERVLVIQRAPGVPYPGYWCPPSGKVEPGESQSEAVERELREELGLAARARRKVWECPTHDGRYLLHWWLADADGEPAPDAREVSGVRFVTAAEFARLEPIFALDLEFFERVLPGLS